MRRIAETRTVTLVANGARSVEGRVRVEGMDARAAGRGVLFERHRPFSVVVHEAGSDRELPIREAASRPAPWLMLAAPALALAVRALVRTGRPRTDRSKGR